MFRDCSASASPSPHQSEAEQTGQSKFVHGRRGIYRYPSSGCFWCLVTLLQYRVSHSESLFLSFHIICTVQSSPCPRPCPRHPQPTAYARSTTIALRTPHPSHPFIPSRPSFFLFWGGFFLSLCLSRSCGSCRRSSLECVPFA